MCALRRPDRYRSVSAFAPISHPSEVPWGKKAFGGYLGEDRAAWAEYDAVCLLEAGRRAEDVLVDEGAADPFLEPQLEPEQLRAACAAASVHLTLRVHEGYDHSYYFVATFIDEHVDWHADRLARP